jgi:hypothetical protein
VGGKWLTLEKKDAMEGKGLTLEKDAMERKGLTLEKIKILWNGKG